MSNDSEEGREQRDERQPMDPTRQMLRVFGVTVSTYEEKMAALLARSTAAASAEERVELTLQALDLAAGMTRQLRIMNAHVLETQERTWKELLSALRG